MAAAKRLDADYQEAWGEYEDAMLREDADAAERDAVAQNKQFPTLIDCIHGPINLHPVTMNE